MEVILLPSILPDTLNLATVNRRLLTGEVKLDWSNVQSASDTQLRVLLAGLDLVDASEILGIETVPDALADAIGNVLSAGESRRGGGGVDEGRGRLRRPGVLGTSDGHQDQDAGDASVPAQPNLSPAPTERQIVLDAPSPARMREMLEEMVISISRGITNGFSVTQERFSCNSSSFSPMRAYYKNIKRCIMLDHI